MERAPATALPSRPPHAAGKGTAPLAALTIGALGVVFGDIGTSPLYTFRECLRTHGVGAPSPEDVYGLLSLIFWSLTMVVTVKYLTFIMRADNHGEGGIFALLAVVPESLRTTKARRISWVALVVVVGAALLYGDGAITPAISVLSAVEGLTVARPSFAPLVVPLTCVILLALFLVQRRGTGIIGAFFGPLMVVWFVTIGALGLEHVIRRPGVLLAILPHHAVRYFAHHDWKWPLPLALGVLLFFLSFDVPFFVANTVKILDGGWVPVLIGVGFIAAMLTWSKGRALTVEQYMRRAAILSEALPRLLPRCVARVPGLGVFMSSSTTHVPLIFVHLVERERALKENIFFLHVSTETIPQVPAEQSLETKLLYGGVHQVIARYGFMQEPDVPAVVRDAISRLGLAIDPAETTYYLGRESVLAGQRGAMGRFAEGLFGYLQRNAVAPDLHFKIPPGQVIEIGIQLDL